MIVVENYAFTPGARGVGTIVIPEVIELEDIQRIWNVTRGALIYEATNSQYGIVSIVVANGETTLTIETDTSTMSSGDSLQILLYDDTSGGGGGGQGPGMDGTIDAFGRERVSSGYTLADYKSVYGADDEMLSATSGGGSSVAYQTNLAASRLTAGSGATDYAQRQSRMYHNYQPGKSQLIFASFNLYAAQANCNKRIGYFDDRNGIFLQLAGDGTLSFVRRSYVTGSVVDTTVAQSSWNVDPCDGSGPSGFDLSVAQTQLLFIDFQWLGVGRIRIGFVHDGAKIIAHEFYHSNVIATAYWSQPSLPIRAEVRNTAATSGATYLDMICSTVISEGGYAETGDDFSVGSAVRSVGNSGAVLPVIAIRLTNTLNGYPNRQYIRLSSVNIVAPAQIVKVEIIRLESHAAIAGGAWVTGGQGSGVEYNITATTYTPAANDNVVDTFFLPSGGTGGGNKNAVPVLVVDPSKAKRGYIAQNIAADTSMAFLVHVTSLGNNATAAAAIQWREIS